MQKLIHFFIPRESNNHKAKVLHPSSLILITFLLVILQFGIKLIPKIHPSILGYASSISANEIVRLTNEKRAEVGLSQLKLNNYLSIAAQNKGNDMLAKDYWAHVAPDGTQPWKFFNDVGYKYRYAGENLARDFMDADSTVKAWMASPTHKENILNPKYKEIGIGVVEGDLAGLDTTIVVQFFGSTSDNVVLQPEPKVLEATTIQQPEVLISPFNVTKTISMAIVILLIIVFITDSYMVFRKKITRITGRTFAHVVFLSLILVIIILLKTGKII